VDWAGSDSPLNKSTSEGVAFAHVTSEGVAFAHVNCRNSMTRIQEGPPVAEAITAEVVAKAVAGILQIGVARRALEGVGHPASIVGNRISVAGIEAHLHTRNGCGWWQVFATDGTPPVWTVGTSAEGNVASWTGALE
jgi:hypothetical protein